MTTYNYTSTLRPVASIGWGRIPNVVIKPGCDPTGTVRDFETTEPLTPEYMADMDIVERR